MTRNAHSTSVASHYRIAKCKTTTITGKYSLRVITKVEPQRDEAEREEKSRPQLSREPNAKTRIALYRRVCVLGAKVRCSSCAVYFHEGNKSRFLARTERNSETLN